MSGYNEAFDFEHHKKEFESLIRHLTQAHAASFVDGAHVLDLGGGAGMHAGFLATSASRVTTVDIVDPNVTYAGEFLKLLREKHIRNGIELDISKLEFHRADAMDLPYKDGLFDLVVSFNAFEHIPDPGRGLQEALRVTRPQGFVFITFDPIWTADTGSHFASFVPEPWAHLVLGAEDFLDRMKQSGAEKWQMEEFRYAMNRVRLGQFEYIFECLQSEGYGEVVCKNMWSGTSHPDNNKHPNLQLAQELGYSKNELLARGLAYLIRRSTKPVSHSTLVGFPAVSPNRLNDHEIGVCPLGGHAVGGGIVPGRLAVFFASFSVLIRRLVDFILSR